MSALTLTKTYGDSQLLSATDVTDMWTELESKTNGNIDNDNVATGWASFDDTTLAKDTSYTMGTTNSALIRFYTADNSVGLLHDTTARKTLFKSGGTQVGEIDTSSNFTITKDIYFYNRSTTYPLSYLIGYGKPVLVYSDGTTINVEQNTTTANTTLIVFPTGPIAVTEDVAATHKFRQLKTSASANGYGASHTGAADSGMKVGLSLTANTWYFVYAVKVQYGDDAGNKFILVVDSTNPSPSNWSTLDTAYGAGMWVYLGLFRYGHGGAQTTTMIPFLQDSRGGHSFTGRAAAGNFFGVRVASSFIDSTSFANIVTLTAANSGNAAPAVCPIIKITMRVIDDSGDGSKGCIKVTDSSDVLLWNLPAFSENSLGGDLPQGWEIKIPNQGLKFAAKRHSGVDDDYDVTVYISAVLDEWA